MNKKVSNREITGFVPFFIAMMILALPIVIANQYYIDDMGRAMRGFTGWAVDGRPLAEAIMRISVMNLKMVDIFPLPLLAGCAFAAYSMQAFQKKYLKPGFLAMLVPLSLLVAPSTPEILSYRFDSLTMLISIFLPLLLISKSTSRIWVDFLAGTVVSMSILSIYQPSINIFVVCVIAEFILNLNNNKKLSNCFFQATSRTIQLTVGTIIYMGIILPCTFSGVHSNSHPGITTGGITERIKNNAIDYYSFLDLNFFSGKEWIFFSICFLVIFLCIAIHAFNLIKKSEKTSLFILAFFIPLIACMFSIGTLLTLDKSIVHFSRLYIGVGGLTFLTALCFNILSSKINFYNLSMIISIPLIYIVIYTYSFGAASKAQWDYTTMLMRDIKTSSRDMKFDYFVFNGPYAKSPILVNSENRYPIFKFNIPNYFYNWVWPYKRFELEGMNLYQPPSKELRMKAIDKKCETKHRINGRLYDLYLFENVLVIDFAKSC